MKRLVLLMLMVFLPLVLMAQNQHFKISQDAEFGSVSGSNSAGFFSLSISRNSDQTTASLSYSAFSVTSTSIIFTNVIGTIPASAFTGQTTQHLVLDFNTSGLDPTTSINETCTFDFTTLIDTCTPLATGLIHLEFTENDAQRTRVLALGEEIVNGPVTTRIHQRSDNATANVVGSILGTDVSGSPAQVGVNHLSSIEVIHQ